MAIKWWLHLIDRNLAQEVAKTFLARLLTGSGLADLLQRANEEPVAHRVPSVSFTIGVEHHHMRYDA